MKDFVYIVWDTPITFLFSSIFSIFELLNISCGKAAPYIFALAYGIPFKKMKKLPIKDKGENND